jgi:ubiquinone biosynthesis protein Coq4
VLLETPFEFNTSKKDWSDAKLILEDQLKDILEKDSTARKAFRKLSKAFRAQHILEPKDYKRMFRLEKILKDTRPPSSTGYKEGLYCLGWMAQYNDEMAVETGVDIKALYDARIALQ